MKDLVTVDHVIENNLANCVSDKDSDTANQVSDKHLIKCRIKIQP